MAESLGSASGAPPPQQPGRSSQQFVQLDPTDEGALRQRCRRCSARDAAGAAVTPGITAHTTGTAVPALSDVVGDLKRIAGVGVAAFATVAADSAVTAGC